MSAVTILIRRLILPEEDGYQCTARVGDEYCLRTATRQIETVENGEINHRLYTGHAACDDETHIREAADAAETMLRQEGHTLLTFHNENKQAKYEGAPMFEAIGIVSYDPETDDLDVEYDESYDWDEHEAAAYWADVDFWDYEPNPYDGTYSED